MPNDYTSDARVQAARAEVLSRCQGKAFSDIVDSSGHQYVDFVMEGGGVLGVALVGFTYMLEQANIRFLGLGGTSAGSINALVLAAMDIPQAPKAERLVEVLADIPMDSFIDGDSDARDFCRTMLARKGPWKMAWKAAQVIDNLNEDLGLNPGHAFETWLGEVLVRFGVRRFGDVEAKLRVRPPGLMYRDGRAIAETEPIGSLALVTADITTETRVDLPRMAELYWEQPSEVPPQEFARASMSIPGFFHPVRRRPPAGRAQRWEELAQYTGRMPEEVLFVDGGIMSNFPIDLFHKKDRVPAAPTFGAKIGVDRKEPRQVTGPGSLISAIFDSARHTLDYEFIKRNPDYRFLVSEIDTGDHNWLDFHLSDTAKLDLFRRGAECAAAFLCKFDWPAYKEIRRSLAAAHQAGGLA